MEQIYKISTTEGPLYMTASDRAKYQAYTKVLGDFEKMLIQKYGQQFNLLIKPAEYKKAIFLHDRVNTLVQDIKAKQNTLKAQFNR